MGEPWFFHSVLLWTAVTFSQDFQYTKIVKEARFGDPESSWKILLKEGFSVILLGVKL